MGRESRVRKVDRRCKTCGKVLWSAHAIDLRDHANLCKRAAEANLVLPEPILTDLMAGENRIVMP